MARFALGGLDPPPGRSGSSFGRLSGGRLDAFAQKPEVRITARPHGLSAASKVPGFSGGEFRWQINRMQAMRNRCSICSCADATSHNAYGLDAPTPIPPELSHPDQATHGGGGGDGSRSPRERSQGATATESLPTVRGQPATFGLPASAMKPTEQTQTLSPVMSGASCSEDLLRCLTSQLGPKKADHLSESAAPIAQAVLA